MADQDYSGYVRKVDFTTLPTVTVDAAADFMVVLDATDGALKKGLPPTSGGGGGGDVVFSDTPNNTVDINSVSAVDVMAKNLTIAAGDVFTVELWGTLLNNSTAARTYTPSMQLAQGGNLLTLTCTDGATVGFSATNRAYWRVKGFFTIVSASAAEGLMESDRAPAGAANTVQSIAATTNRKVWNTTTSDMTGSATISVRFLSSAATATQQFAVYGYQIRQHAQQV